MLVRCAEGYHINRGLYMSTTSAGLKLRVTEALTQHVGPALEMDGTLLEVLDITDGVARIRLNGVCGNCPSSIMMVVNGIEEELRKQVPEISYIEAVP